MSICITYSTHKDTPFVCFVSNKHVLFTKLSRYSTDDEEESRSRPLFVTECGMTSGCCCWNKWFCWKYFIDDVTLNGHNIRRPLGFHISKRAMATGSRTDTINSESLCLWWKLVQHSILCKSQQVHYYCHYTQHLWIIKKAYERLKGQLFCYREGILSQTHYRRNTVSVINQQ